jgi:hypothetical protein
LVNPGFMSASAGATLSSIAATQYQPATVTLAAGSSGSALPIHIHGGRVSASAGSTFVSSVFATQHWAEVAASAGLSLTDTIYAYQYWGEVEGEATVTSEATATQYYRHWGEVAAQASSEAAALASLLQDGAAVVSGSLTADITPFLTHAGAVSATAGATASVIGRLAVETPAPNCRTLTLPGSTQDMAALDEARVLVVPGDNRLLQVTC